MSIEYTNPRFNADGSIDVDIEHPDHGTIPFTASKNDIESHGRELFELLKSQATPYVAETE